MSDSKHLQYTIRVNTLGQEQIKKLKDSVKKLAADQKKQAQAGTRGATAIAQAYTRIVQEVAKVVQSHTRLRTAAAAAAAATQKGFKQMRLAAVRLNQQLVGLRDNMSFGARLREARMGFIALAAASYGLKRSFDVFADFQQRLAEVNTLVGMSQQEFKALGEEIVSMTRRIPQTAAELTQAQYDIISAGVDLKDSLHVLELSAQAAIAGVTDTQTAVLAGMGAINAYGMEISELGRVYDVLFKTVKSGVVTFPELASSIGTVLPMARAAGVDLETVSASIAEMTKQGIRAPIATTALRAAIIALQTPTAVAAKKFEELGIEWNGLIPTLQALEEATGGSMEALRELVPEVRARQAIIALTQDIEGLAESVDDFHDSAGEAQEAYEIMADTPENQMRLFRNEVDAIRMAIGAWVSKSLLPLAQSLTKVSQEIQNLTPLTQDLLKYTMLVGAATALWAVGGGKVVAALLALGLKLAAVVPLLSATILHMSMIGKIGAVAALGVTGLLAAFSVAGLAAIAYAIVKFREWREAVEEANRRMDELREQSADAIQQFEKFRDFRIPDNIVGNAPEEMARLRNEVSGAIAYWTAYQNQQQAIIADTSATATEIRRAEGQLERAGVQLQKLIGFRRELLRGMEAQKLTGEELVESVGVPKSETLAHAIQNERSMLEMRVRDIQALQVQEQKSAEETQAAIFQARTETAEKIIGIVEQKVDNAIDHYGRESEEYKQAIESMKTATNELASLRDNALQRYQNAMQNMRRAEQSWAQQLSSTEKTLHDLRTDHYTDLERAVEDAARAEQMMSEARRLAMSDNLQDQERAKSLLDDAIGLYKQQATEIKEVVDGEEKVVQTREEGIALAIQGIARAQNIAKTLQNTQVEYWRSIAESAKDEFGKLDDLLIGMMQRLNDELNAAFSEPKTLEVSFDPSWAELERRFAEMRQDEHKTIYVNTIEQSATGGVAGRTFPRRSGKIPGHGTVDDVPSLLMRGEYVVRSDAVSFYGENLLEAINRKVLPVQRFASGGFVGGGGAGAGAFRDPVLDRKIKDADEEIHKLEHRLRQMATHASGIDDRWQGLVPRVNLRNLQMQASPQVALREIVTLDEGLDGMKTSIQGRFNGLISEATAAGDTDVADMLVAERNAIMSLIDDLANTITELRSDFEGIVREAAEAEKKLKQQWANDKTQLEAELKMAIEEEQDWQRVIRENADKIQQEQEREMRERGFSSTEVAEHFKDKPPPSSIREMPEPEQVTKSVRYAIVYDYPSPSSSDVDIAYQRVSDGVVVGRLRYRNGQRIESGYIPDGQVEGGRYLTEEKTGSFFHPQAANAMQDDLKASEQAIKGMRADHQIQLGEYRGRFDEDIKTVDETRRMAQGDMQDNVESSTGNHVNIVESRQHESNNRNITAVHELERSIEEAQARRLSLLADLEEAKRRWKLEFARLQMQQARDQERKSGDQPAPETLRRDNVLLRYFNQGGSVDGQEGRDRVPAMLTAGEYVLSKPAVDGLGRGFLDMLNNLRLPDFSDSIQRFAEGGLVGDAGPSLGTLNLQIGGAQMPVQAERDLARQFINQLKLAGMTL